MEPDDRDRTETERELVTATQHGDRLALDTLLARHLPSVRAFVRVHVDPRLRARESESDVVQSVCRELLGQLSTFEYRGEGPFRHWLYVAALNKVREKGRFWHAARRDVRRDVHASLSGCDDGSVAACYSGLCSPSRRVAAEEQLARVEAALDQLPEHYREVITLAKIVGLSQAEIAEQMDRTLPSVRQLLSRALVKLSGALARHGG